MAVEVKFTICEESNCESINFRELTGAYNASTNTTGWGAPNEVVGDAVSATLVLKSPSGVTYSSIDMLALSYPTVDSFAQTEILASTVDSSLTTFADGFWTITYSVTTGTTTYTQTKTFFLYSWAVKTAIWPEHVPALQRAQCATAPTVASCMHVPLNQHRSDGEHETSNAYLQANKIFPTGLTDDVKRF